MYKKVGHLKWGKFVGKFNGFNPYIALSVIVVNISIYYNIYYYYCNRQNKHLKCFVIDNN